MDAVHGNGSALDEGTMKKKKVKLEEGISFRGKEQEQGKEKDRAKEKEISRATPAGGEGEGGGGTALAEDLNEFIKNKYRKGM